MRANEPKITEADLETSLVPILRALLPVYRRSRDYLARLTILRDGLLAV